MLQHTVQTPYMVGEVHCYSAELEGGIALFDCGPPTPEAQALLRDSGLLDRLQYLFCTHCHVDHSGLVNYVIQNSSAKLYLPRKDAIKFSRHAERMDGIAGILRGYGFAERFVEELRESYQRNKVFPPAPEHCGIVEDAPELERLGVRWIACPGHSQSDLVYLVGDCAVTGDILLRNIFQAPLLDIDLDSFSGRFRNYDAYCASLPKLVQLRGLRILPGHRDSVDGVDATVIFYVTTFMERALKLLPLRSHPVTEIIDILFQGRLTEAFYVYLKISEIVFMLDFLENPALLKASLEKAGLFDRVAELYQTVARQV